MRRILVAGGAGFIGRETLPFLLEHGYEVYIATRSGLPNESPASGTVNYHRCDLLRDSCEELVARIQPTHLLHFAWYAEHGAFSWALENLDWVAASLRLAWAFPAGGGRAVFAGSCAEYDWSFDTLNETLTPLNPATLYGLSKATLYRLLSSAAERPGIWSNFLPLWSPRSAEPAFCARSSIK